MRRDRLWVAIVASLLLWSTAALAAPETITVLPISIDLPFYCDQEIDNTSIPAVNPQAVSVNPLNGDCWFAAQAFECCGYYEPDQSLEWVVVDFPPKTARKNWCGPCDISESASRCEDYIIPIAIEHTFPGFREPASIGVNPSDNSVWIAEPAQIVHTDHGGGVMWSGWDYGAPQSLSVYPTDGSCWVADTGNDAVVHLSNTGSLIYRNTSFSHPNSVSVNQVDGSCWVADSGHSEVVQLSKTGAELWRGSPTTYPFAVAVNSTGGSCWVADPLMDEVIKIDVEGQVRARVSVANPRALAVNATHSDVWVAGNEIVHLNFDGTLRDTYPIANAASIAVNTSDSTVWVADTLGNEVTHLDPTCTPFCDIDCWFWAVNEIVSCYNANLVMGYEENNALGEPVSTYHCERIVTRDQMAAYIARALAGGDANVPPPPLDPHFSDLLHSYWATKYIEYCYSQGVVQGYEDGMYHPTDPVNRAQMAVYIARSMVDPLGEAGLVDYVPPTTPTFPDVSTSFWAYKHIEYCAGEKVVQGYTDGKYYPDTQVTRDQMAVYISRAFHLPVP